MPEIRGKIVPVIALADQTVNIHWLQPDKPEIVEARAFPKPRPKLNVLEMEIEMARRMAGRAITGMVGEAAIVAVEYAIECIKRDRDGRL
jgi:hypothetical protein